MIYDCLRFERQSSSGIAPFPNCRRHFISVRLPVSMARCRIRIFAIFPSRRPEASGFDGTLSPLHLSAATLHNVVAHEIGHALALQHNGDPTTLMCGRPASCRPAAFTSEEQRMFPLTSDDIARLRELYPANWHAR
jgi:hypothetical protein